MQRINFTKKILWSAFEQLVYTDLLEYLIECWVKSVGETAQQL